MGTKTRHRFSIIFSVGKSTVAVVLSIMSRPIGLLTNHARDMIGEGFRLQLSKTGYS